MGGTEMIDWHSVREWAQIIGTIIVTPLLFAYRKIDGIQKDFNTHKETQARDISEIKQDYREIGTKLDIILAIVDRRLKEGK